MKEHLKPAGPEPSEAALAEAILACEDIATLARFFAREIARYGYDAGACGAFLPAENRPEPHFFFMNWPQDWQTLYQERNFVEHDFSVFEARRRIAPFTWLEIKASRVLSAPESALWETVVEWGWTDGFTVPIHGPGGYFAIVAMAGREQVLSPGLRARLQLIAVLTHERCRVLTGLDGRRGPVATLTARELECLRWVAAGKTDWEIGAILSLSPTTAKFHIEKARRKLGVRTRAQAVARLVLWGES